MPQVSVVILNWNGKDYLRSCLSSFRSVTQPSYEIIVVDNASTDGSVEMVRSLFPHVRLIAKKRNTGFAGGNNFGWKAAKGKYVLFLNNDTVVTPDFLTILVIRAQKNLRVGCLQPEMRVMTDKKLLDAAGSYLTPTGFLFHYGYRKPHSLPQYKTAREIFSAKGACMLIPQKVLQKVGGFDEDFFICFEETDLCHRIWLAGYSVVYDPAAFIYHVAGGDTGNTYDRTSRIYLTFRNMNYSYIKNFGPLFLWTIYPVFLTFQLGLLGYFTVSGKWNLAAAMLRAYGWLGARWTVILRKRHSVQRNLRNLGDRSLKSHVLYAPDWYYYYCLFFHADKYRDHRLPHYEI